MPVNVKCSACQNAMKVPDEARGRAVKCTKCGEKVKVPGGDAAKKPSEKSAKAPAQKPVKKPAKQAAGKKSQADDGSSDDLASLQLDDFGGSSDDLQICPFCAATMPPPPEDEEEEEEADPVCRNCGMNVETGKMDPKEARQRARKGPLIEEFYAGCWKDAWSYLWEYKSLAIRSAIYWTVLGVMAMVSSYMGVVYSTRTPPKAFWGGITLVILGGMVGWYWCLSMRLIQAAMQKEKIEADRVHIDMFTNVALGLRGVIWPIVLMLPAVMVFVFVGMVLILGENEKGGMMFQIAGGVAAVGYVMFPLALVHMTAKYAYKAWIVTDLAPVFFKTFASVMYWWMVAFVAFLPVLIPLIGMCWWLKGSESLSLGTINPLASKNFMELFDRLAKWLTELMGERPTEDSWTYWMLGIAINLSFGAILISPITFIAGFCAVFLMRVTGQFGYYNQLKLGMIGKINSGTPATIGVRFLGFFGDLMVVPIATLMITGNKNAWFTGLGLDLLCAACYLQDAYYPAFPYVFPATIFYHMWLYFAVSESSGTRSTIGKDAFGLIVQSPSGKQLTLKQASKRFFLALWSGLACGIGFFFGAFNKQHRTVHDILSNSVVVWRGDK